MALEWTGCCWHPVAAHRGPAAHPGTGLCARLSQLFSSSWVWVELHTAGGMPHSQAGC